MPAIETKVVSGVTYERYLESDAWVLAGGIAGLRAFTPPTGKNGPIAITVTIDLDAHTATGAVYVWAYLDEGVDNGTTIITPTGWTSTGRWLRLLATA